MGLPTEEARRGAQIAQLLERAQVIQLKNRQLKSRREQVTEELVVRDIVVADIQEREALGAVRRSPSDEWTQAQWSLPMKILEVKPTQVCLARYGERKEPVWVHKDQVRKFKIGDSGALRRITVEYVAKKLLESELRETTEQGDGANTAKNRKRRAYESSERLPELEEDVRRLFGLGDGRGGGL